MKPLALSDEERAAMARDSDLAVDSDGIEVLRGLTREESEWYVQHQRGFLENRQAGKRSSADRRRFIGLHEVHERARLTAIGLMHVKPQGNA